MRGESLYRLGKYQDAQECLALVPSKWPMSPVAERAELFWAMALVALGQLDAGSRQAAHLRERAPKGEYAGWRSTRATGDFDLRTFAIRAYPVDKIEGLRPGMSVYTDWSSRSP